MQATFLLGPAGSGKTFRCLGEIREELRRSPEGPPLIFLAPKQATFQLERQLLAESSLAGYTRLHILSFERLAEFVLDRLGGAVPRLLGEQGRVMVLRALLIQRQGELKIFRASARLNGFAQQLSLLLREFQRHHLGPARLDALTRRPGAPPSLRDKLHDIALLLHAYDAWLKGHDLQDANDLLDVATIALRGGSGDAASGTRRPASRLHVAALWLDGFAEMTPQELELLAALMPFCGEATLAFCLEVEPTTAPPWLSTWSVVGQTFLRCRDQLAGVPDCTVRIDSLPRRRHFGRFAQCDVLRSLESQWAAPPPTGDIPPRTTPSLQCLTCADAEAEAVLAAREILRQVQTGDRFRDCAVIVRDLEPYHATLARVFRRYGIPFFMDRRESVAHHPLAELTRFALRTVAFNWRHDDWFGALKSGLVPVRDDLIDSLENDALARGLQGGSWLAPFPVEAPLHAPGPDTRPASAAAPTSHRFESLRQALVAPFAVFAAALTKSTGGADAGPGGRQLAAALRRFWSDLDVGRTLDQWMQTARDHASRAAGSAANPAIHDTVLEQMHEWLDNLELAFRNETLPLREWLPILEAGLASLTVGVIPPALDQVVIGAIDRSRNPDLKLALVLGLNEGVFPAAPVPGMLLTDSDRAALERQDVFLGPTPQQRLGHERYLGYIACTRASQRLILVHAERDSRDQPLNPSPFLDHVRRITGVASENAEGDQTWRAARHACELEAPILAATDLQAQASAHPERQPAFEDANGALLELAGLPAFSSLLAKWNDVRHAAQTGPLPLEIMEKIFSREMKTSVSGLEDFAACPFKFFVSRALRLEEREEFAFDHRDRGTFQHQLLEAFHNQVRASGRDWRQLNTTEARVMVTNLGAHLAFSFEGGKFQADGAARFARALLIERAARLVGVLVDWMRQYSFDPVRAEISFGFEPDGLPAWRLELGDGHALLLRGRIDRVDVCREEDGPALAVVMDYKSRARKLNSTRLHHGLELQLLSYLGVLQHLNAPESFFGVRTLSPVGVFYVPLNPARGNAGASRAEVLAARDAGPGSSYQHRGRFLADALQRFDSRGGNKGDQFCFAITKEGKPAQRGNEALPRREFEQLRETVEARLRDHARRIFSGETAVAPYRMGAETACERCDFRAICRFDPWTQEYRQLRPPTNFQSDSSRRTRARKKGAVA